MMKRQTPSKSRQHLILSLGLLTAITVYAATSTVRVPNHYAGGLSKTVGDLTQNVEGTLTWDSSGTAAYVSDTKRSHTYVVSPEEIETATLSQKNCGPLGEIASPPQQSTQPSAPSVKAEALQNAQAITQMVAAEAALDRGNKTVAKAQEILEKTQRTALQDHKTLADLYKNLAPEEQQRRLAGARDQLDRLRIQMEGSSGSFHTEGEKARFTDLVKKAIEKINHGQPITKNISATSEEAIMDRFIMFYGLPPDKQSEVQQKMQFIEKKEFSGKTAYLLHSGYILDGQSGQDCSEFVTATLKSQGIKGSFTTTDFKQLWKYLDSGIWDSNVAYPDENKKSVKALANDFVAVRPSYKEQVLPGDILVYRLDEGAGAHVVVVKDYNSATQTARIIEASQTAGSVVERDFSLTLHPQSEGDNRPVRPGLHILRFRGGEG